MKQISLYEVRMPRGDFIYALVDTATKWVWTERSYNGAREMAISKGYEVVEGGQITQPDLLRLMGQEPPKLSAAAPKPPAAAVDPQPTHEAGAPFSGAGASVNVTSQPTTASTPAFTYHWDEEQAVGPASARIDLPKVDAVITTKTVANAFFADKPVVDGFSKGK